MAAWTTPPVAGVDPVVCINGGMLADHTALWPALAPLAAHRQVVLYDQRGRGESEPPPDPLAATIEDDADDVGALRRALGIRRWDVLGHSWGGGIAALGAAADLGGVRRLVLVDAVGPTSEWMPELRQRALERLDGEQRAALEAITDTELGSPDPQIHARQARAMYPAWFANAELAAYFAPPKGDSATGAAVLAKLRTGRYDWRDRARALSVPSLVLHGDRDALPPSAATAWATVLPRADLHVLPGSGHMPFWEAPHRFFALVESFLSARTPGLPPSLP